MTWSIVSPPTVEPISLEVAKLHLRVDWTVEDDLILALVAAARTHVEVVCERALMPQTWAERTDGFTDRIELRGGVVSAIDSITYVDGDGVQQSIDPSTCVVDLTAQPAVLMAPFGTRWPIARQQPGSVVVTYRVGYADAESVPAPIKSAILLYVGDLYTNRANQQEAQLFKNTAAQSLLWPWRRVMP
jgi:uncharacterized phiE125 gp8 family phage protein